MRWKRSRMAGEWALGCGRMRSGGSFGCMMMGREFPRSFARGFFSPISRRSRLEPAWGFRLWREGLPRWAGRWRARVRYAMGRERGFGSLFLPCGATIYRRMGSVVPRITLLALLVVGGMLSCKSAEVTPDKLAGTWVMRDSSREYLPPPLRKASARIILNVNGTFIASDLPLDGLLHDDPTLV